MKKLLLILICLFVSFEVKSESDDLSGKKLICESPIHIHGYKFIDDFRVVLIMIDKKKGINGKSTFTYTTNKSISVIVFS